MMENAQSSGISSRSMVRNTSVFLPDLTSLIDERGTEKKNEKKERTLSWVILIIVATLESLKTIHRSMKTWILSTTIPRLRWRVTVKTHFEEMNLLRKLLALKARIE